MKSPTTVGIKKSRQRGSAQKMKFCIKDFFSKSDQIRSFLQIWSHFLKKSLIVNFIFVLDWSRARRSKMPSLLRYLQNYVLTLLKFSVVANRRYFNWINVQKGGKITYLHIFRGRRVGLLSFQLFTKDFFLLSWRRLIKISTITHWRTTILNRIRTYAFSGFLSLRS